MKHGRWAVAVAAVLAAFTSVAEGADDLTLKRVLLSTGGVGYFEYETTCEGERDLPLVVPLAQVDDVLKSIVIYDDKGNLGSITLPGKELLTEAFRDLPFTVESLESPTTLLTALRGADVKVEMAGRTLSGRIVSVTEEQEKLPSGDLVTRHRLTVLDGGALQQAIIEDIQRLTVLDEALRAQIEAAMNALGRERDRDEREITVHLGGTGSRTVRVAYVVAAPLWKTTYRLLLPKEAEIKTADIEGFAVVENRSGRPFHDVDITLASGDPVTFRQALYTTYYVNRPTVPVEVLGRILPMPDEGAIPAPNAEAMPPPGWSGFGGGGYASKGPTAAAPTMPPGAPVHFAPAEGSEQATQVTFHVAKPVSIENGQSAILPLLARTLPAERVSLYQPDTDKRHPLSSVKLTNDGDTDLPPGVLAIYSRSGAHGESIYDGDAQLSMLPVGASRFMSYAVDLRVTVDRRDESGRTLALAKVVDGVLVLTRTERRATTYTVAGAPQEPRTVILEHPRIANFEPEPSTDYELIETSATHYRLKREIPAGATVKVTIVLDRPLVERVAIQNLTGDQLGAYANSEELPAAVRETFAQIASLSAAVADKEAARDKLTAERNQILTEQARLRDNLKVVPSESELYKRYLGEMMEQEDRLKALDSEISTAENAVDDARKALAARIRSAQV